MLNSEDRLAGAFSYHPLEALAPHTHRYGPGNEFIRAFPARSIM
jgi:hypothetical protein